MNTTAYDHVQKGTPHSIHKPIQEKLDYFISQQKIPNIIFHGPSGSGKKTLLTYLIRQIYKNDSALMKKYTMYVNCAYGKGIKFIREELKFFAKTHIQEWSFKSIILLNADKLTVDAQSALRRCIELFNHNTRFFIVIEDKYKLLKPILSRFCEIYVPSPIINNTEVNLHQYFVKNDSVAEPIKKQLKQLFLKKEKNEWIEVNELIQLANQWYEKGYSGLDIMNLLENHKYFDKEITLEKRYELLICFHKVIKEIRNEKLLFFFMLHFLFLSSNEPLENLFFM